MVVNTKIKCYIKIYNCYKAVKHPFLEGVFFRSQKSNDKNESNFQNLWYNRCIKDMNNVSYVIYKIYT